MNFDDAMAAHIIWKLRLTRFVDGTSDEKLDSATIARDDVCELGKWLSREGSAYQTAPAFQSLVERHAEFHRCAADVVNKVLDGDRTGANALIDGPIEAASRDIVRAIAEIRTEVSTEASQI